MPHAPFLPPTLLPSWESRRWFWCWTFVCCDCSYSTCDWNCHGELPYPSHTKPKHHEPYPFCHQEHSFILCNNCIVFHRVEICLCPVISQWTGSSAPWGFICRTPRKEKKNMVAKAESRKGTDQVADNRWRGLLMPLEQENPSWVCGYHLESVHWKQLKVGFLLLIAEQRNSWGPGLQSQWTVSNHPGLLDTNQLPGGARCRAMMKRADIGRRSPNRKQNLDVFLRWPPSI